MAGVASVQVSGGFQRQIQVQVDCDKLDAYGLSLAQVANAIQRENLDAPGGNVDVDPQTFSVRASGLAQAPDDLEDYVVPRPPRAPSTFATWRRSSSATRGRPARCATARKKTRA